jgi:multisubunit Na+/H+ antiporter MnhB subunit
MPENGFMNKAFGIAMLAVGLLLLVFGINESRSTASEISRVFTNSPTDRAIWFLAGGAVGTAVGAYLLLAKPR